MNIYIFNVYSWKNTNINNLIITKLMEYNCKTLKEKTCSKRLATIVKFTNEKILLAELL